MSKEIFSFDELLVIKILGRKKKTITEITEECFIDKKEAPMDPNIYIANVVRRISKKCDHYKLPWTIVGEGGGRGGRTVWREKRSS
jgi:hypothetical protein